MDPELINNTFLNYYKHLYTSCVSSNHLAQVDLFLDNLLTPQLEDDEVTQLELPIENLEIYDAINTMEVGKAPGPDGLPIEIYKLCKDELVQPYQDMLQESFASGKLPQSMTEAEVILFLKKGKDPLHCDSYRPIALINCDAKVLAKIIAARLQPLLVKLIGSEQAGFVTSRNVGDNLVLVFEALYARRNIVIDEALVALDMTKAFDSLELPFLWRVLVLWVGAKYLEVDPIAL